MPVAFLLVPLLRILVRWGWSLGLWLRGGGFHLRVLKGKWRSECRYHYRDTYIYILG